MPTLSLDGQTVTVPPGSTLLEAARQLGLAIPTLCWRQGFEPSTSCMVCAVKIAGRAQMLPACATPAAEGMVVTTDDEDIRRHRREVMELILSEHAGDCEAPCQSACPAHLDIPAMARALQSGALATAAALAHEALVLPQSLGMICPGPCEKACRRGRHDAAVAIGALHRAAAAHGPPPATPPRAAGSVLSQTSGLQDGTASVPGRCPGLTNDALSGRRTGGPQGPADAVVKPVTVVGAGPAGLAAAAALARRGWACQVLDDHDAAGGMLRCGVGADRLPPAVLEAEVAAIAALGVVFRLGRGLESAADLERLRGESSAVLLAMGTGAAVVADLGLAMRDGVLVVDRERATTSQPGVFAAGGIARDTRRLAVRAVASGRAAAEQIDAFLRQADPPTTAPAVVVRLGALREGEMEAFLSQASPAPRAEAAATGPLAPPDAAGEAARCLHCDCRAQHACALREVAGACGASPQRWTGTRRTVTLDTTHPEVIYEPGKCIACGLCIQACARAGERLGLAFHWRGMQVRVGAPLNETLAAALTLAAADCVAVCPTGALAWKRD
ncbi:MAG: NAD(P)-binding protein [Lentisphaerae bacterium]|nr:NAD(P)-binding protein [Lentisphaerota bacterium]